MGNRWETMWLDLTKLRAWKWQQKHQCWSEQKLLDPQLPLEFEVERTKDGEGLGELLRVRAGDGLGTGGGLGSAINSTLSMDSALMSLFGRVLLPPWTNNQSPHHWLQKQRRAQLL
jgi:hypothetical protein